MIKSHRIYIIPVALLLVASALAYLPNLIQATVYRDDWYYVLDRIIGGPGVFQAMFSIDRPARGPFFELYYQLFGVSPLPYHLASYVWRCLGGLAALWLFRLLWPKQPTVTMVMALFFVLFPGYLRWMEGFEDQPGIASLCLEVLSIALTLKAICSSRRLTRILAWTASILTGWAYLALVDFAIGMEVFRLLCVFILVDRPLLQKQAVERAFAAIRVWVFAAVIPAGFLFWRLFIFHNERHQTDIGRQLSVFLASPLTTAAAWLMRFLQSFVNVSLLSWLTPAIQGYFGLRPREALLGAVLALLTVATFCCAIYVLKKKAVSSADDVDVNWRSQAIWVGLIGVAVATLPVVAANRYVDPFSYSHYALPASLAAGMAVTGLLYSLTPEGLRQSAIATLIAYAVLAHYSYSSQIVQEERIISDFWHQVVWRAPDLRPQTTLFINYPGVAYMENVDAVQGPANIIYFPGETDQIPVTYPLFALPQGNATTTEVLLGKDKLGGYRTHTGLVAYEHLLVISQPSQSSCVHAIREQTPLFSSSDPDQLRIIGAHSQTDSVLDGRTSPVLPPSMFGLEPPHGWCYYFEKADLALQAGDWEQVASLGKAAAARGLHAEDSVEWTPFLEAYAHLGEVSLFIQTAHRINVDPFAHLQACTILTNIQNSGLSFDAEIQIEVNRLICDHG